MDAETSDELPGTRPQQRRRALVEFELEREPEATDFEIARRVKSTTARVASIRADLGKDGNANDQGA